MGLAFQFLIIGRNKRATNLMKGESMNLAKGFKRLTLVVSLLIGPLVFLLFCTAPGHYEDFSQKLIVLSIFEIIGFVIVWSIYLIALFVVKGFHHENKAQKNE